VWGHASINSKKSRNEHLAAVETRSLCDEVRILHRKLAQTILNDDMAANGKVLMGN
jgi:hypothetical protein